MSDLDFVSNDPLLFFVACMIVAILAMAAVGMIVLRGIRKY